MTEKMIFIMHTLRSDLNKLKEISFFIKESRDFVVKNNTTLLVEDVQQVPFRYIKTIDFFLQHI